MERDLRPPRVSLAKDLHLPRVSLAKDLRPPRVSLAKDLRPPRVSLAKDLRLHLQVGEKVDPRRRDPEPHRHRLLPQASEGLIGKRSLSG